MNEVELKEIIEKFEREFQEILKMLDEYINKQNEKQ